MFRKVISFIYEKIYFGDRVPLNYDKNIVIDKEKRFQYMQAFRHNIHNSILIRLRWQELTLPVRGVANIAPQPLTFLFVASKRMHMLV